MKIEKIGIKDLTQGEKFDFGFLSLKEEEIIEFAKLVDPLDFHIDMEVARNSIFKGLIASGPHLFTKFYKERWLPYFKPTVKAGLGVNNWRLIKPVYVNQEIHGSAQVRELKFNFEKKHAVITWHFEFNNLKNEMVQSLEITILHWLE